MGAFLRRIREHLKALSRMGISVHASHASFFLVLSAFPGLLLAVGLLRYTSLEASDLMGLLEESLPDALELYLFRIISSAFQNSSVGLLSLSAVTALWSAGRGIQGLAKGLNSVYGVSDRRGWLRLRLASVCHTVLFMLALPAVAAVHVLRPSRAVWGFLAAVAVQTLLFCGLFMFLPGRRNGFRESLPGALVASLGWTVFTGLFSVYVENFNRYTNIYGSVYGLILAMLWLYMCVSILFYGGVLNRFLKEKGKL